MDQVENVLSLIADCPLHSVDILVFASQLGPGLIGLSLVVTETINDNPHLLAGLGRKGSISQKRLND